MKATATITVGAPREQVQTRWREFAERSESTRLGPIEVEREQPGGPIAWRTREGSEAKASGIVSFAPAPADRGTELHLELEYDVPAGAVGAAVKKVTGDDPHQMAQDDLRRFKQLVETGEIARSQGAPMGHSAEAQPKQRPAQPLEHAKA